MLTALVFILALSPIPRPETPPAIPEPSTLALAAIAAAPLLLRRTRR